ncbi:MAG: AMP-binding protein [Bacteroidales bacterium]|nr:AMP-binding protein [Bacteroidales bacterium]MDY6406527.1 AMP-binding protein [Bacteroidales bacterium]
MATKHYLSYLQETMHSNWDGLAMTDLDGEHRYTYAQLAEAIAKLHTTWRTCGIKEGDKIALCGRNCANWGLLFLAVESYKAVVVSILPDFTAEGIYSLVDHSEAVLLYVGPNVKKKIDATQMKGLKATIFMDDMTIVEADDSFRKKFESADAAFAKEYPDGVKLTDVNYPIDNYDDLAVINYTSGSTGNPKGVMLTHLNLSGNVEFAHTRIPHKPGDTVLSMLPIAHMFGLMFEFLYQICEGAAVYFLTQAPTPTVLMKAFAQVKPFMILTVPLVVEKIIKKGVLPKISSPAAKIMWKTPFLKNVIRGKVKEGLDKTFGGQLRYLIIGGAALNGEVEQVLHDIKYQYCVGYGMTECGPLISYEDWFRYAFHSCGKELPQCHVRIDSEDPTSKDGEIQVKGINVMKGYYKNEEATKAVFTEDGWMRTGDLGVLDKEGNIYIHGRSKNMILGPSGQNIYPEEIEDKLNSMPCVVESIVVEREGKLVALVFPDTSAEGKKILGSKSLTQLMEENRVAVNKDLPNYSPISAVELVASEFEKTPKRSIKRYLYK